MTHTPQDKILLDMGFSAEAIEAIQNMTLASIADIANDSLGSMVIPTELAEYGSLDFHQALIALIDQLDPTSKAVILQEIGQEAGWTPRLEEGSEGSEDQEFDVITS